MSMLDVEAHMPKQCGHCGEVKRWPDFPADARTPDGRAYRCKACKNAAARASYHWNIERSRQEKRSEYRRNGARRRADCKVWRTFWADQMQRCRSE